MRFSLRRFVFDCNAASGYFGILFTIFFFVVVLTVLSFYIMPYESQFGELNAQDLEYLLSENYTNASYSERGAWLSEQHGGSYRTELRFELALELDFFWETYLIWPDGFQMKEDTYNQWKQGTLEVQDAIDVWDILGGAVTLNIGILNELGFIGIAVKVLIGLSVCIIIYLMLPFTG